jgi:hypothetical protein
LLDPSECQHPRRGQMRDDRGGVLALSRPELVLQRINLRFAPAG